MFDIDEGDSGEDHCDMVNADHTDTEGRVAAVVVDGGGLSPTGIVYWVGREEPISSSESKDD